MKTCFRCRTEKSVDEFHRDRNRSDGRHPYCRACVAAYTKTRDHRADRLWAKYRLRREDFDAMVCAQDGQCASCGDPTTDWHVDHDHTCCPGEMTCGKCIRALLCGSCNGGLGRFKDSPERLRAAADYLERHLSRIVRSASARTVTLRTPRRHFGGCP